MEQARRMGTPLPEKLANAPLLTPGLEFYYVAFISLSSERAIGFGEGRIPWSKAKDYAAHHRLSQEDFERFWLILSHMDGAYLKFRADKSKKESSSGGTGKTPIGGARTTTPRAIRKPPPVRKR